MRRVWAVLREAWWAALTQPVASVVSIVIVAGMCAAVLLTTGRTVGAERAVLASIDSAGTRTIVVRADSDSALDTSVLPRLAAVDGISWLGAFGPPRDVTNITIPTGPRVPLRTLWLGNNGLPTAAESDDARASRRALDLLGMPDGVGVVSSGDGRDVAVTGELAVTEQLRFLEPLLVIEHRGPPHVAQSVSTLVVVAARADLVGPLTSVVRSLLDADPATVTITTSENLATLRAAVEGQLGSFGRNLVVVIFAATGVLVAAILYGLVMLRRRDFGRRRALGATRALIIQLLLVQMGITSIVGAALGCGVAVVVLVAAGDPLPGVDFVIALGTLAVAVGLLAASAPAVAASRRDPLRELRLP